MGKTPITEFENQIEKLKQEYSKYLLATYKLLENSATASELNLSMIELHNKGVAFFNLFERSLDEYGLSGYNVNSDTKNRKIEDAEDIVKTIISHWTTIRLIADKYNLLCPEPSSKAYSTIQRFIKLHSKREVKQQIKNKFMTAKLPTNGFDSKAKHSGWKIGSRNNVITQIIIGLLFISCTGFLIFYKENLTGMQYFFVRSILVLGIVLIGSALFEAFVDLKWTIFKSFTIKAFGWGAIYIVLYYHNPPPAPMPTNTQADTVNNIY